MRLRCFATEQGAGEKAPGPRIVARKAAVGLIALIALVTAWQCRGSWTTTDVQAEHLVTALAKALDYQTDSSLRSVDALLADAIDRIDPKRWPDPDQIAWFRGQLAALPEARNLVVIGADGVSVSPALSAHGQVGQPVDLHDREYYQFHRDHPGDRAMHLGDPVTGRADGHPIIPLSRAILDANGQLRGVISVSLDPASLLKSLESLAIEDGGGISIIRMDGVFLARLPDPEGSLGKSAAASALFRSAIPRNGSGVAHFESVTDGNDKIVAYRTLARYPVVATIGITRHTAFAAWRVELYRDIASVCLFAVALLTLATQLDRREQARARLAAQLEAHSLDLETQVADRTRHLVAAQEEAERRAAALAASNADLEQFAYVASHDLREPLRSVSSYVQLLQRRYGDRLDGEGAAFMGFVMDGTHRMHELITDLLAYSRVGSNQDPFASVAMDRVLSQVLASFSGVIAASGAVVTHGPLPSIDADERQMVSLFENLIGNAIKYRRPEIPPIIRVDATLMGQEWTFAIGDNGIGIEPAYWTRIFMIFQRLHARDQYEGTGIGLALCKRIVERHGGRIWLASTPGEGSTFFFTLPAARPADHSVS